MRKLDLVPAAPVAEQHEREDSCMTRRAILATLAAAALTACSSTTVITPSKDAAAADDDAGTEDATVACTPTGKSAGAVTGYPQGTWKAMGAYIIGHDAGGLFAFSTV